MIKVTFNNANRLKADQTLKLSEASPWVQDNRDNGNISVVSSVG